MALDRKRSQRSPRISSSARNRGIDAHGVGGGNLATVPEHYQHQQLQYQHHQQQQQQQVDRRPPVTKCKTCCRKFLAFLVSNVGLCVLVVAYSVGGAFMFRAIEAPFEVQTAKQVTDLRNRTIRHLWNITYNHNVFNYSVWRQSVIQEIKYFQTDLLKAIKDGYEGQQDTGQEQWSFSGAFLFSLTVISTIANELLSPGTYELCESQPVYSFWLRASP
ncbi:potassium channel subfamily K member 12-like [Oppia nitens]|uniref:potassium channel subfamily K member 12-like n=1 Tax=Oppia nitens TaxID=1686743 RepID=UPI0023DCC9AB|nr:potassium channel subfamily K member 12-like [Oppia nitens]